MRENTDQNNSEYGHFLGSVIDKEVLTLSVLGKYGLPYSYFIVCFLWSRYLYVKYFFGAVRI